MNKETISVVRNVKQMMRMKTKIITTTIKTTTIKIIRIIKTGTTKTIIMITTLRITILIKEIIPIEEIIRTQETTRITGITIKNFIKKLSIKKIDSFFLLLI